jgi:hypothetical protein
LSNASVSGERDAESAPTPRPPDAGATRLRTPEVMHSSIGHGITPNEFVLVVDIDVLLVAIVMVPMLDGPPGIGIFLPAVGEGVVPLYGVLPRVNRRGFFTRMALFGNRDS